MHISHRVFSGSVRKVCPVLHYNHEGKHVWPVVRCIPLVSRSESFPNCQVCSLSIVHASASISGYLVQLVVIKLIMGLAKSFATSK